jgi:hypothetical protein
MPFLGKWSGEFQVSEIQGGGTAKDMKRESIRGYIQVYATSRSYKMEMEGEQETIDISGTWTIKGHRITLLPETIKIDDQGGVDARDPNKKFIPAEEVQKAYGRPILLSESEDKKSLTGLKTTIGKLTGTHRFVKDSF